MPSKFARSSDGLGARSLGGSLNVDLDRQNKRLFAVDHSKWHEEKEPCSSEVSKHSNLLRCGQKRARGSRYCGVHAKLKGSKTVGQCKICGTRREFAKARDGRKKQMCDYCGTEKFSLYDLRIEDTQ